MTRQRKGFLIPRAANCGKANVWEADGGESLDCCVDSSVASSRLVRV